MKTIGTGIKILFFSLAVLVLGSILHWHGRTVSDQVQTQVAHAERSETAAQLKKWTSQITEEAKTNAKKAWSKGEGKVEEIRKPDSPKAKPAMAVIEQNKGRSPTSEERPSKTAQRSAPQETIAPTERQKLRALIEELNGPQAAVKTADRESN